MKAIKINVTLKGIYEITLPEDYREIYRQLECNLFTLVKPDTLPGRDTLYIDDEGLLRDQKLGAFSIRGYPQVLSGHGLIIGGDEEGESISCISTVELIKQLVRFEDEHYLPEPGFIITTF